MEQYRVVTLSISGKGRKIHRLGDKVTQSNLAASVEELLASGAIVTEKDWVSRETRIKEEEKKRLAQPVAFMPGYGTLVQTPTGVSDAKVPPMTTDTPTATTDESGGTSKDGGQSDGIKPIEQFTKKEIEEELDKLEVDYKTSESKETLYNLLVKAKSVNA